MRTAKCEIPHFEFRISNFSSGNQLAIAVVKVCPVREDEKERSCEPRTPNCCTISHFAFRISHSNFGLLLSVAFARFGTWLRLPKIVPKVVRFTAGRSEDSLSGCRASS